MSYTLAEIREIPIFFIVGKGRSGTTLLSNILDGHPNVASATESRFLLLIWQKYKHLKCWKAEMADSFFEDLMRDYMVKYLWEFHVEELMRQLREMPAETKAADLIKLVYIYRKSSFPKEKINFIVDKNPMYTIFVPKFLKIFKEAKFIRIIRDPRDNITSHIKFSGRPVTFLGYKWLRYNTLIDKIAAKNQGKFLSLRFEDLILDKDGYFKDFEDFTGIKSLVAYENKRLENKEQLEKNFSDRLKDQHQSSVKPLDPKKIGHYKSKLSDIQIRKIETICFPYSTKYKYIRELEPISIGIFDKLRSKMSYEFHFRSNKVFYNLPFKLTVNIYAFFIKYVLLKKKDKLKKS